MPMRHGLTLGEMGHWFIKQFNLDVDYRVIAMEGWQPDAAPGFGWPDDRAWINPSPNAANLNMARAYAGTVMLEGATLSEGRGTTRPLELFGAPDIDARAVLAEMERFAPQWLAGCKIREVHFEPTFHKHAHTLCNGLQFHPELGFYDHHAFRPWRLQALAFKAIRNLYPDYDLWRDFPYEYVFDKLAIDVINGGPALARMGRRCGQRGGRSGGDRRGRMRPRGKNRPANMRLYIGWPIPSMRLTNASGSIPASHRPAPRASSGYMRSLIKPLQNAGRRRMPPIGFGRRIDPRGGGVGGGQPVSHTIPASSGSYARSSRRHA